MAKLAERNTADEDEFVRIRNTIALDQAREAKEFSTRMSSRTREDSYRASQSTSRSSQEHRTWQRNTRSSFG
jgi:hypothetical protein